MCSPLLVVKLRLVAFNSHLFNLHRSYSNFILHLPPFPTKTVAPSFFVSRRCQEEPGEMRGEGPSSWKAPGKEMPSCLEPPLPLGILPGHSDSLSFAILAHLAALVMFTVPLHRPSSSISSPQTFLCPWPRCLAFERRALWLSSSPVAVLAHKQDSRLACLTLGLSL